ncbi:MAG TPA: GIY-YIG nuclease family protein [Candidatus Bathyarchaeia archaeon]|nr:GIY-YIG nuclease family protein [Candidatus Bathyarchaeia archaeon]
MDEKRPAVYILASKRNGTLYTGVTTKLRQRIWEHKNDVADGFTKRYGVHTLVYCEFLADIRAAIVREKQIKKWNRRLLYAVMAAWPRKREAHALASFPRKRESRAPIRRRNALTGFPLARE